MTCDLVVCPVGFEETPGRSLWVGFVVFKNEVKSISAPYVENLQLEPMIAPTQ